jgi:glycosyltransferase involved in cell wall biosynthesis
VVKAATGKAIAYVSVVHPLHDHRFLYKQCSGLVNHGYTVDYHVRHEREEVIQGVSIKPLRPPQSRLRRFVSTFSLLPGLLKPSYVAYHLVDPELLPLGMVLKARTRRLVVFDAHEDYVDFIKHKHYLRGPAGGALSVGMRFLLHASSRALDGFVFADKGTAGMFKGMPEARKCLFYNFPLRSMFPEELSPWGERPYDLVFLGTMSRTSGIWVILDAVKLLKVRRPGVKCLFIGIPGEELRQEVFRFVEEQQLRANVEFTGRLPHGDVPLLLQRCKVGIVGLLDLPKFHSNIATKLFEYLASGIPVVSSDLPPEREFIPDGECGKFYKPGDAAGMADAIDFILSRNGCGPRMSANARRHVLERNYFAEGEIAKLAGFYSNLLAIRSGRRATAPSPR